MASPLYLTSPGRHGWVDVDRHSATANGIEVVTMATCINQGVADILRDALQDAEDRRAREESIGRHPVGLANLRGEL